MFNKGKKQRKKTEVDSSSMADIAFLLLIFFLVTTTIVNEKGVNFILPKKKEAEVEVKPQKERNVFKVLVNSNDKLLVNDTPMEAAELKEKTMEFLSNNGKKENLSESPSKAIVSYKVDRGTSYDMYLTTLDELKAAYHQLRADKIGISLKDYLYLDKTKKEDELLLKKGKDAYPMQLSEAEPTELGKY